MKYKVGDKIKIRTWEDMEQEYGSKMICLDEGYDYIPCPGYLEFTYPMEKLINKVADNRVLTIKSIDVYIYTKDKENIRSFCYSMEEADLEIKWTDDMIQCLVGEEVVYESPKKRWQILDLRG